MNSGVFLHACLILHFSYVASFNPHNGHMRAFFSFPPFYRSVNRGKKAWITCPKLHTSEQQAQDFYSVYLTVGPTPFLRYNPLHNTPEPTIMFGIYHLHQKQTSGVGVTNTGIQNLLLTSFHDVFAAFILLSMFLPNFSLTRTLSILKTSCLCFHSVIHSWSPGPGSRATSTTSPALIPPPEPENVSFIVWLPKAPCSSQPHSAW